MEFVTNDDYKMPIAHTFRFFFSTTLPFDNSTKITEFTSHLDYTNKLVTCNFFSDCIFFMHTNFVFLSNERKILIRYSTAKMYFCMIFRLIRIRLFFFPET